MSERLQDVLVVTEEVSGWKALYVDGQYKYSDESIPISEIISLLGGRPSVLRHEYVVVDRLCEDGFPVEAWRLDRA